eukprot:440928_1
METVNSELQTVVTVPTTSTNNISNIVPLSRREILLGGISSIVIMMIGLFFEIWLDSTVTFDHSNINSLSALNNFGDLIMSAAEYERIQNGIFIFVFPLHLLYYVAMVRSLKICFTKYHTLITVFSLSYIFYAIFINLSLCVSISVDSFFWSISFDDTSQVLPSSNMIQLYVLRLQIACISLAIYFGSIAMFSFWLIFICALFFDSTYNNNLRIYLCPSCFKYNSITSKIIMILLASFTLIGSYLSVFSWSYSGFWSLSGGSQTFQIFTIFSSATSGVWLIWFGISRNYDKFNDRTQLEYFL